jgi:23S rRNA pseudouridine2605 synthase
VILKQKKITPASCSKLTRLNKFISNSARTARRKADELIIQGRVTVNKKIVKEPGIRIDPENDVVKLDGEKLKPVKQWVYIVLYKPAGYITTTSDDRGRPTVMDLIGLNARLYPVGRLDYDTEGVLLLTNDGYFANLMMHPSREVFKVYLVKVDKPVQPRDIEKLRKGIVIDGRPTARAEVKIIENSDYRCLRISIHEGRNRQIKRMFEALGYRVVKLKRIQFAGIGLGGLKPGQWRYLTVDELKKATELGRR